MATAAIVVFLNGGLCQLGRQWDRGTMTQWHCQQWHLLPMVVVVIVVIVVSCAAAVGAADTIPSSALTAVAKLPLLLLPSSATSINNDYYCHP